MIGKTNVAGENLTAEMTAQETIIEQIREALVGKVQGANATADKILAGYKAYVGQQLVEGTYEPVTGIDFGEVTLSSAQSSIVINHSLGVVPDSAYIFPKTLVRKTGLTIANINGNAIRDSGGSGGTNEYGAYFMVNQSLTKSSSSVTFQKHANGNFAAQSYVWIALGGDSN